MVFLLNNSKAHFLLTHYYPQRFSLTSGVPIVFKKVSTQGFAVIFESEQIIVSYCNKSAKYRALGQLLANKRQNIFQKQPPITFRAVSIDVSRNGVLRIPILKEILIRFALLGINKVILYIEDTFEVAGQPLIGYKRGAYSKNEIKEVAIFAKWFGIELIPGIQTLGHLSQILKFDDYFKYRDNKFVLNANNPETYELVESLILNAVEPFGSKYIHVGLDETDGIGRGQAFKENTLIDPLKIFLKHLKLVSNICKKIDLHPIVWTDVMLEGNDHIRKLAPEEVRKLPNNIFYNYWNYYSSDIERYKLRIEQHRDRGMDPIVSPGVWNWNRFWGWYPKFYSTAIPCLEAAKDKGCTRVSITMWGDDGQECPFNTNWPSLCLFAESCWTENVDLLEVKKLCLGIVEEEYYNFVIPSEMDSFGEEDIKSSSNECNIAKCLLYDDPLLRLYTSHVGSKKYNERFSILNKKIEAILNSCNPKYKDLFHFAYTLTLCLSFKSDLGNKAFEAYQNRDHSLLLGIVREAQQVEMLLEDTWEAHRKVWLQEHKPFGIEIIDKRYAATIFRVKVFRKKIASFIDGHSRIIEEFEEQDQHYIHNFSSRPLRYKHIDSITTEK